MREERGYEPGTNGVRTAQPLLLLCCWRLRMYAGTAARRPLIICAYSSSINLQGVMSPNSERNSIKPCTVKFSYKSCLQISLSRDQSFALDSHISFDKNWVSRLKLEIGDQFFLNLSSAECCPTPTPQLLEPNFKQQFFPKREEKLGHNSGIVRIKTMSGGPDFYAPKYKLTSAI